MAAINPTKETILPDEAILETPSSLSEVFGLVDDELDLVLDLLEDDDDLANLHTSLLKFATV